LILIDTNIILELLLGQSRGDECEELLNRVSRGELEAVITHFSVHAIGAVLTSSHE
jgi:predicted nucleic acid-binding protein